MNNFKLKFLGFTLIEIIFVIAILGIIITLGISYTSKFSERAKEKTAALQIQQILQAGMSYYVDYGEWPDKGNTSIKSVFYKNYLPISKNNQGVNPLDSNPWQSLNSGKVGYYWEYTGTSESPDDKTKGLFKVSTEAPNEDTAKRVISLLPNAFYESPNIVAEVGIPGQAMDVSHGYVISAGSFKVTAAYDNTCSFMEAFTSTVNDGISTCRSKKSMHAVVSAQIQNCDLNIKADSAPDSDVDYSIIFGGVCEVSLNNYGIYYSVRGDYRHLAVAYARVLSRTKISYIVMCLPGDANSADQQDVEYAATTHQPCQSSNGTPKDCKVS